MFESALIKSHNDLITSHKAICEGFLLQALAKIDQASPFVAQADLLLKKLKEVNDIKDLVQKKEIEKFLIAAAGFSDKARSRLQQNELDKVLEDVLNKISENAGDQWREEIVYRFLLTRGDSLGGMMRNITGALAGTKFAEAVMKSLQKKGIGYEEKYSKKNKIQAIFWDSRSLLFDRTPKCVNKNIDVILLNTPGDYSTATNSLEENEAYLCCGELKGGIDPAGADEHWKTANSALQRIRLCFADKCPKLFFVGAAIEASMALEIYNQLQDGRLSHAANLNEQEQLHDLTDWLVSL
jgi:hypothetical protein